MNDSEFSLADVVARAISPLLIMSLVGSLVFFLIEVLYAGQYYARMQWILFFFVFGSVLVARIAMHGEVGNRAGLYGIVLGGLMWLALRMYVQFPPGSGLAEFAPLIQLGLVVLILWSTHRLTYDCTLVDEDEKASGAGLLDAAGLDQPPAEKAGAGAGDEVIPPPPEEKKRKKKRRDKQGGFSAWWERYEQYREDQKQKPKTHGVWIVYFSLAALPLFGLGQALIPPDQAGRRLYTFWLLSVYVASGLGLLLTTTFLSLRRYLRQRQVRMPASITATWLTFGSALVVILLVVGALMPRPNPEYSVVARFLGVDSPDRKASRWAMRGGEPGEGEGGPGSGKNDENAQNTASGRGKAELKGEGKSGQGEQGRGQSQGEQSGQNRNQSGNESGQKGESSQQSRDSRQGQPGRSGSESKGGESENGQEAKQGDSSGAPESNPNPQSWFAPLQPVLKALKWVVMAVVILVVVFVVGRSLLRFLANFTFWARDLLNYLQSLWDSLWGQRPDTGAEAAALRAGRKRSYRPFSSFADPFLTGSAEIMSPQELVRYSFEALQAWARERGMPRGEDETPLEFAGRVGEAAPALAADAAQMANYYAAAAYAPWSLKDSCRDALRQFWLSLAEAAPGPAEADAVTG